MLGKMWVGVKRREAEIQSKILHMGKKFSMNVFEK